MQTSHSAAQTEEGLLDIRSMVYSLPPSSPFPLDQPTSVSTTGSSMSPTTAFHPTNTVFGTNWHPPGFMHPQYVSQQWNISHDFRPKPHNHNRPFQNRRDVHPRHLSLDSSHPFAGVVGQELSPTQPGDRHIFGTAAVPSTPLGPPRKPKQSGYALWVGNLPRDTQLPELKDHFAAGAKQDIESVLLISKSNCAFVNYKSAPACEAAVRRFHRSFFRGNAVVCRVRKNTRSSSGHGSPTDSGYSSSSGNPLSPAVSSSTDEAQMPVIVESGATLEPEFARADNAVEGMIDSTADGNTIVAKPKQGDKFIILKSLTEQDLRASLRNGTWATQPHNEPVLNKAFANAEKVYLIFSANKSGEYFGYAQMSSEISTAATSERHSAEYSPTTIITPATETAPKGRIVDDSARGTLFWEADCSDVEDSNSSPKGDHEGAVGGDSHKSFQIDWISTSRVPFHRTRGLYNPWNENRAVKIARDGTELEPSVGRRLLHLFDEEQTPIELSPRLSIS